MSGGAVFVNMGASSKRSAVHFFPPILQVLFAASTQLKLISLMV